MRKEVTTHYRFFFKLENNIDIKKFKNVCIHIDNILIVNWLKT